MGVGCLATGFGAATGVSLAAGAATGVGLAAGAAFAGGLASVLGAAIGFAAAFGAVFAIILAAALTVFGAVAFGVTVLGFARDATALATRLIAWTNEFFLGVSLLPLALAGFPVFGAFAGLLCPGFALPAGVPLTGFLAISALRDAVAPPNSLLLDYHHQRSKFSTS